VSSREGTKTDGGGRGLSFFAIKTGEKMNGYERNKAPNQKGKKKETRGEHTAAHRENMTGVK